ncbi:hypothetical protein TNCV_3465031 [Trichonephila clavipes]|nr:hypothetical protein TNCV_3465031 [Trichonephila clavipes]
MCFFAETCYVVHFNNPMMALSKSYKGRIKCFPSHQWVNGYLYLLIDAKPAFFLNTEDLQLPQTKNETPATVELMQQLQHLLLWNLIQQLQRLPSHLHVLVAKSSSSN